MHGEDQTPKGPSNNPLIRNIGVCSLFLLAFLIRLYHIDKPPLDYNPIRQYQCAHIARGYYYMTVQSIPDHKRHVAILNMERMGFLLEPRIMETLAVIGYRIAGGEYLLIPRLLSVLFWLTGGIFLYLIAKRLTSPLSAYLSTTFYLFIPFGILASRTFQPDPMMIMFMLCGMFLVVMYYEKNSISLLALSAIVSSLALLLKPYSIFMILATYISIGIYKNGIKKTFLKKETFFFLILCLLLPSTYYIGGLVLNAGFLKEHTQASFLPHLLFRSYFWRDWLIMIGQVVGIIPFILGLVGLFMTKRDAAGYLFMTLWLFYLIYGLVFTFHIHTHNYYHLLLIPVAALSIGYLGSSIIESGIRFISPLRKGLLLTVLMIILTLAGLNIKEMNLKGEKEILKSAGLLVGVTPEFYKFLIDDFKEEIKTAREIGKIVNHSTETVFLTSDFGRSLTYHGEFSGLPWPISTSLQEREERGLKIPAREELFNPNYLTIRTHGRYIKYKPEYFIVTDLDEFERQPELRDFLFRNFPLIAEGDYLIFDLKRMATSQ